MKLQKLLLFIIALTFDVAEGRIGSNSRRRLRHRKLFWADDDAAIPDQYIIVFEQGNEAEVLGTITDWLEKSKATQVVYDFDSALNMVTLKGVEMDELVGILEDSKVAWVEEDQVLTEDSKQMNPPSWGLDRIDQATLPLNSEYQSLPTGKGVEVYIFDSGVNLAHNEFSGRARCGYNAISQTEGRGCDDTRGHGSHVAGTVAGLTYGVAKEATIVAVKVLSDEGAGSLSGMVNGVNYVIKQKQRSPKQPMVANLSISGRSGTPTLDKAISDAVSAGIIFVVSAGNYNSDSCAISPARAYGAITVGSTDSGDKRSGFSNYGSCVNIFAPGSNILSAGHRSKTDSSTKSGTSMAAPHVAGAAALYLEKNPSWTSSNVLNAFSQDGVKHMIQDAGPGSPNLLLNLGASLKEVSSSSGGKQGASCKPLLDYCVSDNSECCGKFVCNRGLGRCFTF